MWHYIIISGASRGFGKAMALRFAKIIQSPVHFSLAGRSSEELAMTATEITAMRAGKETICDVSVVDLADIQKLPTVSESMFKSFELLTSSGCVYSKIIFVNNAGSLGPLTPIGTGTGTDLLQIDKAIDLNVTSYIFTTSEFMRKYKGNAELLLVNVSSLAAIQPFPSWAIYCAGKAARDMFYRILAEENKGNSIALQCT